ncbi:MAG: hypothetical protein AB7O98_17855 [Hyphomonadaceae bacterium]
MTGGQEPGQTAPSPGAENPVTLRELAAGVRDDLLQWDRGILGVFVAMTVRPAHAPRAFIFDRDPRYAKPWRYLLFGVLTNVAATWFIFDALGARARLNLAPQGAQESLLLDNAAILTLVTLPLMAIAVRLWFIGLKVRYLDALIVLFYVQGHINIWGVVALAAFAATGQQIWITVATMALLAYFVWALASFARGPWWRRLLAAALSLISGQLINAGVVFAALRIAQ